MEQSLSHQLAAYLDASPSCYHAVQNLADALTAAGYARLREAEPWTLTPGGKYFVIRGGASMIAFRVPAGPWRGFLLAAAHSDSPSLKVRETAEVSSAGNCRRLSVEPFGGMILRSWLDRPLSAAGRVMVRENGGITMRLVNVDRDLLVIPSVAVHMDRNINKGTALDPAVDMLPLFGGEEGDFRRLIEWIWNILKAIW